MDRTTRLSAFFVPGPPGRLAAAINASPESFYAGSVAGGREAIAAAAQAAVAAGAGLLDIGAMSTAPYKDAAIDAEEERRRMVLAIHAAREAVGPGIAISADTSRATVAAAALEVGADIINDVTGLLGDPAMGGVIAAAGAGAILMANDSPTIDEGGRSPVEVVAGLLRDAMARATAAGIPASRLVVDPGLGFFRGRSIPWYEWDMALLRGLGEFRGMAPLLVGASRKSFLGHLLGRPDPADRLAGSLAVAYHCTLAGVDWLRVHDVAETRDVVEMARRLR